MKHGVDSLTAGTATHRSLFYFGIGIMAIGILVICFRFLWRMLIIGFSRYLENTMRNQLYDHVLTMDQPFFEKHSTGDIMAHSSNDLGAVQMACGMGLVAAADALILSIAAIGFMIHIHPMLTLFALLPMPILAISTKMLSGKLHTRFNTVQEQFAVLTEYARSALISVKLCKAYSLEDIQNRRFDALGNDYVKANIRVAMIQGLLFPAATLIGNLGLLAILVYGGSLVIKEVITMGDFVAFITYLQMLIWPMMAVGWVTNLMQRGVTALRRIYRLISTKPLLVEPIREQTGVDLAHPFSAQNLNFSYPEGAQPTLHDLNLIVEPGVYGIAGKTGSGKSTLCRLLVRLYPVKDHSLFFGGVDVNRLTLDAIRSRIAYVSQEPVLFSDTIAANIRFGKPDADEHEIIEGAKDALMHDEIMAFAEGYETKIGERGISLSGGQRQRLALARALVSDREILVIDDGLSAVDTETESLILQSLQRRFEGKSVFIVSNRVKLLAMTRKIFIFKDGRLTEEGTHEQLKERNPFYQAMYEKQLNSISEASHA